MQRKEDTEAQGFASLPISIRKDAYENGKLLSLLSANDVFRPSHRTLVKSLSDVLGTEYTFTEYHYHDGVEVMLVDKGCGTAVINDRAIPLSEGDVLVVNSFEAHGIFLEGEHAQFTRTCIAFRPYYLFPPESADHSTHFFADLKNIHFSNRIPAEHPAAVQIADCLRRIVSLCESGKAGWSVAAFSQLLMFYSVMIAYGLFSRSEGSSSYMFDFMTRVSSYIENHLDQDITTADVATYCQYSTEHFCRLFKKCFNKTFKDYLNFYRIRKAMEFIEHGEFSTIAEVSSRFGFNNQNHFGHMFKKYVGILPSEYISRQKMGKESL